MNVFRELPCNCGIRSLVYSKWMQDLHATTTGAIGMVYLRLIIVHALYSKKSPTGPTERTPNPEYLTALAINLGVRW